MLHIYVTKSDKYIMYYVYIIYILIYYNSCRPETRTYNLWILKNISTRVPYIKIYYFIYHIISSNIFTYIPIVTYCINISLSGVVRLLLMWPAPKGFIKDHASFISHSPLSLIHSQYQSVVKICVNSSEPLNRIQMILPKMMIHSGIKKNHCLYEWTIESFTPPICLKPQNQES